MEKRNAAVELIPWEQIPEEVCRFFEREPDAVCRIKGKIYLQMDREALSCDDNEEGNKVLSAVQQRIRNHSGGTDPKDIWYQIITAPEPDRAAALAKEHGIEYRKKRTVVLFRVKYLPGQPLDRIFSEIAPLEEEDRLAAVDCDTLALIRESAFRSEDEIAEYAAAVIDTMVSEGVSDLQAGIGSEAEDLEGLHQSFEQARAALATGTRYYPNGTLFRYSGQKLERIIDAIPAEEREKLIREFRSGNIGETFDEEMMETVRVFFRNDLNITAASKELFIHRNTLNYRLDKIRRETGLDLRTFQDAIVFRLICGMTGNVR
jgi:sugar diacid utilization regulator